MGRQRLPEDRPCVVCGKSSPEVVFRTKGGKRSRDRRSHCQTCHAKSRKQWVDEHPERTRAQRERWDIKHQANSRLKRKYGITMEDKKRLLVLQGNVCYICKDSFTTLSSANVDHCHLTGVVRGLLCSPCNKGLGFFRDNPERLYRALAYLQAA